MASGKALLRKYIKKYHKKEIKQLKSQNKQCKVSIDYENLNQFRQHLQKMMHTLNS